MNGDERRRRNEAQARSRGIYILKGGGRRGVSFSTAPRKRSESPEKRGSSWAAVLGSRRAMSDVDIHGNVYGSVRWGSGIVTIMPQKRGCYRETTPEKLKREQASAGRSFIEAL